MKTYGEMIKHLEQRTKMKIGNINEDFITTDFKKHKEKIAVNKKHIYIHITDQEKNSGK